MISLFFDVGALTSAECVAALLLPRSDVCKEKEKKKKTPGLCHAHVQLPVPVRHQSKDSAWFDWDQPHSGHVYAPPMLQSSMKDMLPDEIWADCARHLHSSRSA